MNLIENFPIIITFGLDPVLDGVLQVYLREKYQIIRINQEISFKYIRKYKSVFLLIVNTDQPWVRNSHLVEKIKEENLFQNAPMIAICLKKYFLNMNKSEKYLFDDILLFPCNNEDFLTRIEVWTNTAKFINEFDKKSESFSLDTLEF